MRKNKIGGNQNRRKCFHNISNIEKWDIDDDLLNIFSFPKYHSIIISKKRTIQNLI